jgi:hypothetical protein
MRCIKVKILSTLVVAIVTILIILLSNAYPSILFIDTFGKYLVYAQTIESAPPSTQPLEVQIISPNKGQQVPINSNSLSISGTSNDDLAKDCRVSVIVNGIKPYQPAKATGPDGANDYSKWNFLLTSNYASIKEGPDNKITAKLVCQPNLTKWYSVNVTGTEQRTPTTTATTTEAADKLKQTTPSVTTEAANNTPFSLPLPSEASNNNNIINESNTITNNSTSSSMTTIPATSNSGKTLSISVDVDKNVIALGHAQTIEATAYDAITHHQINNAIVELKVTDSSGKTIEQFFDDNGDISDTFEVGAEEGEDIEQGTFTARIQASAVGYQPETKTITFDLVGQDMIDDDTEGIADDNNNDIVNDDADDSESTDDNNEESSDLFLTDTNNNLASKIINDITKKLKDNSLDIPFLDDNVWLQVLEDL